MKVVIVGSTGLVATETIRQALSIPAITSIVGLGRREVPLPSNLGPNADASKLKMLVVSDFLNYSDEVKDHITGADCCIWTIGTTPEQLKTITPEESRHLSYDYLVYGLETIASRASAPFRFIYISAAKSERDQTKKPIALAELCLMRGECENFVIDFAKKLGESSKAFIVRPGIIDAPGRTEFLLTFMGGVVRTIIGLPKCDITEIAAALLVWCLEEPQAETLYNDDVVRLGRKGLAEFKK